MRRWSERAWWFITGALVGTAGLAVAQTPDTLYRKLELLAEVLGQIEQHYVDAVSASDLVYGAAQGATRALDAHSAFFTPDEYRELINQTEGEYAGIGVELDERDGIFEITSVLDGSPAQRAGVLAGDRILAVDGAAVDGLALDHVLQRLRGPPGTKVTIGIGRRDRDQPWTFTLVRSWIRVAPIAARDLGAVQVVQIKTFARRVATDLEAQLHRHAPKQGLVLDLRGNPGGLFDEAVAVCDLFLDHGLIVTAVGKGGRVLDRQEARRRGTEPNYKIAILVDQHTASAAEIVAGALHDRGRARLFGARTYGKGSVQSMLDLSDGSGLKLTIARYLTPSGTVIDGQGVAPDQMVEPDAKRDAPLAAALAWIGI